jgi:hypothetical protein
MKLTKIKIFELLRIYSMTLIGSVNKNCSLYESFCNVIENEETTLTKDDYEIMIITKVFYSCCSNLYYAKDTFQKGFNFGNYDIEKIINTDSAINKKCLENFETKDILIYLRNALAHFQNDLYEIYVDKDKANIKIKLMNTKATKGPNIGNNIPFELELNTTNLELIPQFITAFSNTINITGTDFDGNVVANYNTRDIMGLLEETINSSYYTYSLFNQITKPDKEKLWQDFTMGNQKSNMAEFDLKKQKFLRKEAKINFSENQKKCIFESIKAKLEFVLKTQGLSTDIINKRCDINQIKRILGSFMKDNFEYESLKVIPMGREKMSNVTISILFAYYGKDSSFSETQKGFIKSLVQKGYIYEVCNSFCNIDKQELQMIMENMCDPQQIINESLAVLYGFVFENYFDENDIVTIGKIDYQVGFLRNSFIHGRWYFDGSNWAWNLFDNKDSLKKPDQYNFVREAIVNQDCLNDFIDDQFLISSRISSIVQKM